MAFLNKEESLKLADKLSIVGYQDMSWSELQRAISDAQKKNNPPEIPVESVGDPAETKSGVPLYRPKHQQSLTDAYKGRQIFISPELAPERYRLLKYEEDLGEDINIVERHFEMNMATDEVYDISGDKISYDGQVDASHDYATGTYKVLGKSNKHVMAMSSVPKENYGSGMTIGVDYVPVVTWQGKAGYLWTHQTYPNVKALLQESGYYHEYKDLFTREPNIWYVAGKTLACDIGLVHKIFREIEEKEARKRSEEMAYRERLGIR